MLEGAPSRQCNEERQHAGERHDAIATYCTGFVVVERPVPARCQACRPFPEREPDRHEERDEFPWHERECLRRRLSQKLEGFAIEIRTPVAALGRGCLSERPQELGLQSVDIYERIDLRQGTVVAFQQIRRIKALFMTVPSTRSAENSCGIRQG